MSTSPIAPDSDADSAMGTLVLKLRDPDPAERPDST